jgi:hypothetical protein
MAKFLIGDEEISVFATLLFSKQWLLNVFQCFAIKNPKFCPLNVFVGSVGLTQ